MNLEHLDGALTPCRHAHARLEVLVADIAECAPRRLNRRRERWRHLRERPEPNFVPEVAPFDRVAPRTVSSARHVCPTT